MTRFSENLLYYVFLPLMLGFVFYLAFGSTETAIYGQVNNITGKEVLNFLRPDITLPSFIKFHLADGLWAFSLTCTLLILLGQEFNKKLLLLIANASFVCYELGQKFDWLHGTYDIIDVLVMTCSSFLAYSMIIQKDFPCKNSSYSYSF